jgi:rhamnopyranosyl-N-acetylglucosaminyl-diphospho-decaprenol beta-1,3/1,4-galactofuranosyltransferase
VSDGPDSRVVAVVVTFNRLAMLQELVARLGEVIRAAGRLAEVIVVDNASTDGTGDWLAQHAPSYVVPRTLPDNLGGAGGFREGLDLSLQRGADLAWLMDDDGLPDVDCLTTLLTHEDLDFWGPVVVDREREDRLVFPIRLPGGTKVVHDLADVTRAATGGLIRDVVIPFNGVLVTRELVEQIGSVRGDYFIWGDDHEYRLRAEQAGARIATVVDARVLHPSVGELGTPMIGGRTTYNHTPSDLKAYCLGRNNLVNLKTYKGWPHALAFVAKTVWFYTFTKSDPKRLWLMLGAMRDGLRGDFTGHRRYLG